jgi:hypothetical protein
MEIYSSPRASINQKEIELFYIAKITEGKNRENLKDMQHSVKHRSYD